MIVYSPMVMDEYGENQNQVILHESSFFILLKNSYYLMSCFSHDLALALHNEEERLYKEAQLQQQPQQKSQMNPSQAQRAVTTTAAAPQSKKSKNKSRRSPSDDDDKDSCNIL